MRRKIGMVFFIAVFIAYFQAVTIFIKYQITNEVKYEHFWKSIQWLQQTQGTEYYEVVSNSFGAMMPILLVGFLITIGIVRRKKEKGNKVLHGSARWANYEDIQKMGLTADEGVIVGAFEEKKGKKSVIKTLLHNGPEHILTYAPTRSGKGVGLIVPTLVNWKHSMVATDIKGELWYMTSGYRQSIGNKVLKFEPAAKNEPEKIRTVRWNPLLEIRRGEDEETSDAQSIALLIVDPMGKGLEDHWVKTAYSLLTGCILYLINDEEKIKNGQISLSYLDRMLSDPKLPLPKLWEAMTKSENPIAQQVGQDMKDKPENEAGSIVSTAKSELALYRDPTVAENTNTSDFTVTDIMNSDTPISLYIVVQPSDQTRISPLFRLLVNMLIRKNVSKFKFFQEENFQDYTRKEKFIRKMKGKDTTKYNTIRGAGDYKHRMLMMLDEFPSLGKMDEVQKALAYCAGYGIKCYIIVQDLSQLQDKYGKNESITSNCHIQNAYAPNRVETAKYLSEATGETTIIEENVSVTSSGGLLANKSYQKSIQHTKRNLMTPDECMRLRAAEKNAQGEITRPGEMLIFVAGYPAIRGVQALYFQNPVFAKRASMAAPEKTDTLEKTAAVKQMTVADVEEKAKKFKESNELLNSKRDDDKQVQNESNEQEPEPEHKSSDEEMKGDAEDNNQKNEMNTEEN